MTVEELEDKADEWVEFTYDRLYYPDSNFLARIDARNAFIAGAKFMQKELEKENCELLGLIQAKDKLIEKMKRCKNCEFSIPICDTHCQDCDEHYSNWRLAE